MDRRNFLKITAAASAGLAFSRSAAAEAPAEPAPAAPAAAPSAGAAWKTYEVTTRVEVMKPVGVTRVWLPTPLTRDTAYLRSLGNAWKAEGGTSAQWIDPHYGAGVVWAEFPAGAPAVLELMSRFATKDISVDLSKPGSGAPEPKESLARWLAPTELLPTGGIVKRTALEITKGARTDVEKAHALYEWVVENTVRDPKTRGCGVGDVKFMLERKALGGKCADLNALFVALARSIGIPARDVYGTRVAASALGYKSLGKPVGDVTKAQHCRGEFYLASHGWVPVDPADVRKVILEEGGGKAPTDPMVVAARRRLFGSWEMNWVAYNYGHDLELPGATRGKVGFLMYPQAETAEARLDALDPENFRYTITSKDVA
jgi:transglutaminase-like putative cysteine protease